MTERISLVEQYNNKDVIVQVKKCLDQTAEAVTVSTEARDTAAASATEAHTASQNANAASTQAQTAAQTVATYGTRLQNVEDQSAGNRSDIQTIDGEITDIYNDLTNVVRKVGEAGQVVMNGLDLRGTNKTSDTIVGQLNQLIVNAKRLIEELNAYPAMVRTTGNQFITGAKYIVNPTYPQLRTLSSADRNGTPSQTNWAGIVGKGGSESENETTWELFYNHALNGTKQITANLPKSDGSYNGFVLAEKDGNDENFGFSVYGTRVKAGIGLHSTTIDRGQTPTTGTSTPTFYFRDRNGNEIGHIGIYAQTNGKLYLQAALWSKSQNRLVVHDLAVEE